MKFMKKLIIIGANNFQLPLIIKAKKMGIETHVFAWKDGAIGKVYADYFYPISITEKEKILKIANKIQPDGVISIASDLAAITVNYLAAKLNLIGNSSFCTNITTNKYLMRDILSKNNLPCPNFYLVENNNIPDLGFNYPLIVKPTDRSGSRGVTKVVNKSDLNSAISRAISESFNKNAIIEEFIQGKEYSIEMLSWNGVHHFLQTTEKKTSGAPYFVEKEQHQPADLEISLQEKIIQILKKSLSVLDVKYGASHSEIIITKSKDIYITEIGARMGGDYIGSDLVELSTGFDFVKAVIEVSLGIEPQIEITENNYSGVYYVYPKHGKVISINDNSKNFQEIVRTEIYVKEGDIIGEIKESNQRKACYVYKCYSSRFEEEDVVGIVVG
jgi:biotin carboxylase